MSKAGGRCREYVHSRMYGVTIAACRDPMYMIMMYIDQVYTRVGIDQPLEAHALSTLSQTHAHRLRPTLTVALLVCGRVWL